MSHAGPAQSTPPYPKYRQAQRRSDAGGYPKPRRIVELIRNVIILDVIQVRMLVAMVEDTQSGSGTHMR